MKLFKFIGLHLETVGATLFTGCLLGIMVFAPAHAQFWQGPDPFGPSQQNQGASSSSQAEGAGKRKGESKLGNMESRRDEEEARKRKAESKLGNMESRRDEDEARKRKAESKLGNMESRQDKPAKWDTVKDPSLQMKQQAPQQTMQAQKQQQMNQQVFQQQQQMMQQKSK
jgi:hypothetical protein